MDLLALMKSPFLYVPVEKNITYVISHVTLAQILPHYADGIFYLVWPWVYKTFSMLS